jgi:predicted secreted protein
MKYQKVFFVFFLLTLISLLYLFVFAQGVGYIQIKGDPGANVFFDNKPVGKTHPESGSLILKDVSAGIHELKIVKEGYHPHSEKIDLKPNEVYFYEVSLKPKTGSLLIETVPVDCIIRIPQLGIDQVNKGNKTERYWEISVPIGKYSINFTSSGKKVKYDLEIEEGARKHLLVNILNNEVKELQPVLTWDRTYGGSGYDQANSIIQTADGGYAVAGVTESKGAGGEDFWVIKLDKQGNIVWDRTYGGSEDDFLWSILQTNDGGYAVAGWTNSKGAGGEDFWVIKLDKQGNIVWDRTYGGSEDDFLWSILQTNDGGYAVAGNTASKGAGGEDFWVIKLDKQGNIVWDRTYGGSSYDIVNSLIQTTDGGYAIAGDTASKGAGKVDTWVIKLDKQGNIVWDRTYGGSEDDFLWSLIQTIDGGYAGAGVTESKGAGGEDLWVIKLDKQGNIVWDRTYGGSQDDFTNALIQTIDGGYAGAGVTESKGAGGEDFWVIKLDKQGNIVWDRTYGGRGNDRAYSMIQTTDGGYAIAGDTASKGAGGSDVWIIKLDEKGNLIATIEDNKTETETTGIDNNFNITQTIPVPSFDSYQWEVGLPGFTKPGDITYFGNTKLDPVHLLNPSSGETLSPGDISFSWTQVSNATKYQFILYNSQGKIALDTTVNKTSIKVALGIEETITWKVRAGDNSGNWGPWSSVWSLNVKSPTISQPSQSTHPLQGSLHCPDKAGYACPSCLDELDYDNHFIDFNILTAQEDCYVRLVTQDNSSMGSHNDCVVIIKGEKWLGLENESGVKITKVINEGKFNFSPTNKFVGRTMTFPDDHYQYEFADEGKEFRLYLSRNITEAFQAVPWQNLSVEIKNQKNNKVFTYQFEKGIFPRPYIWPNGVANYGQCVWWAAKRWVEEVDSQKLFPFYPTSPQTANVKTIDLHYKPEQYDILIDYIPGGKPGHYGFVEKVEEDLVYISQFNFIPPGEVYNLISRDWKDNPKDLYYSNNRHDEYYFEYYYRR